MPMPTKYGPGYVFGSLTVMERVGRLGTDTLLRLSCACGGSLETGLTGPRRGRVQDCGDPTQHKRPARKRPSRAGSPRPTKHLPGARFGSLVLLERRDVVKGSQRVLVHCDCGTEKELSLQNLISGSVTNCADRTKHPDPRCKGDAVRYHGAHQRVKAVRGRASAHPCAWCGKPAEQWALGHATAHTQRDVDGKDAGLPYSADPSQYMPMCRRCHARFDRKHRALIGDRSGVSLLHLAAWVARGGPVEGLEERPA